MNLENVGGFNFKPKQDFGEEEPVPEEKPRRGFVASTDEEHFSSSDVYATREEAIKSYPEDAGLDEMETFWVGKIVPFEPQVSADNILQGIVEEAYDSVGDSADGWLKNVKGDQEDELTQQFTNVLNNWLVRHGYKPTFFKVEEVESYEAPAEQTQEVDQDGPYEPPREQELPGIGGQQRAIDAIRQALREFRNPGPGEAG